MLLKSVITSWSRKVSGKDVCEGGKAGETNPRLVSPQVTTENLLCTIAVSTLLWALRQFLFEAWTTTCLMAGNVWEEAKR